MGLADFGAPAVARPLIACAALLGACQQSPGPPAPTKPAAPASAGAPRALGAAVSATARDPVAVTSASPNPAGPKPLSAAGRLVDLEVEGFRDAKVTVPLGTTEKRPVVVALHGNYDRPEWQCDVWRGQLDRARVQAFVLCPRGIPRAGAPKSADRWTYAGIDALLSEITQGLKAVKARWSTYVSDDAPTLAGFSLGAILGVHILRKRPEQFGHVVFIEGGYDGWTRALAEQRKAQQARVLFGCSQATCDTRFKGPTAVLERAGVEVRRVFPGNLGHSYDGAVARDVSRQLRWLFGVGQAGAADTPRTP